MYVGCTSAQKNRNREPEATIESENVSMMHVEVLKRTKTPGTGPQTCACWV